ncbi:MAG: biotin/lipoyl-binding protein [Holophagales bacterium]|jgi:biotin carboxyl carrier protein|nr:biotin/lipoyl-binding protein [Holophagales bacterium]
MSEHVMNIGGKEYRAEIKELSSGRAKVVVNSIEYDVDLISIGRKAITIEAPRVILPPSSPAPAQAYVPATPALIRPAPMAAGQNGVTAPMPGSIFQMRVKEGESVQAGQVLLVMEAMKMENPVNAPFNGTVSRILVREGDNVGEGDLLVELARPEMTTL